MSAKKKWIAGFLLSSVLILGLAVGSAGTFMFLSKKVARHDPIAPVFNLKKDHYIDFVLKRMEHELHLTEEQREAIQEEMQLVAKEFRSLHDQTRVEMDDILQRGQDKIKTYLTSEQIEEYEEQIEKRHFRMKMHHPGRDRRDDGPGGRRFGRGRDGPGDFPPPPPPPPEE